MRSSTGQGMAARTSVDATTTGKFPSDNSSGERSQGEVSGAGSVYAAVLNERPNIADPRNQGPVRAHSRVGASTIPVVTASARNTGRLS